MVAPIAIPPTAGERVELSALPGRTVVSCYPRTGRPDQSCGFRDHYRELEALGARVFGLSTQDTDYQREAVERLHLPFPLLSDARFELASALRLPTFEVGSMPPSRGSH